MGKLRKPVEPVLPPVYDPYYPEIALRGLMTLIPGLGLHRAYSQARR
jgi:hypothetical protein